MTPLPREQQPATRGDMADVINRLDEIRNVLESIRELIAERRPPVL